MAQPARRALGAFQHPPPVGVRVRTAIGAHYLIYSFSPCYRVLNGFLQSLIGLFDFGHAANDPTALDSTCKNLEGTAANDVGDVDDR